MVVLARAAVDLATLTRTCITPKDALGALGHTTAASKEAVRLSGI
jgi:hypothetical protein